MNWFSTVVARVRFLSAIAVFAVAFPAVGQDQPPKVSAQATTQAKAIVAGMNPSKTFTRDPEAKILARKLHANNDPMNPKKFAFLGAKLPDDFAPAHLKGRLTGRRLNAGMKNTTTALANFNHLGDNDTTFHGKSFPVRDQGDCGSCWIFGAIASYEANYIASFNQDVNAAEQHLLNCIRTSDSNGCEGGWPTDALDFLISPKPGTGDRSDPKMTYLRRRADCDPNAVIKYKAVQFGYVNPKSPGQVADTEDIKQAIFQYGAVTVAVNATNDFMSYSGGNFDLNEGGQVNHAVSLVGWKTEGTVIFWRLRNSWGPGWGENGYMWIKARTNQVGFGAMWVTAANGSGGDGIQPNPNCPCPDRATIPNYNAEVLRRIDFWSNTPFAFPPK